MIAIQGCYAIGAEVPKAKPVFPRAKGNGSGNAFDDLFSRELKNQGVERIVTPEGTTYRVNAMDDEELDIDR
jgi:hypothetical protein